jgi:hypothetical protein
MRLIPIGGYEAGVNSWMVGSPTMTMERASAQPTSIPVAGCIRISPIRLALDRSSPIIVSGADGYFEQLAGRALDPDKPEGAGFASHPGG